MTPSLSSAIPGIALAALLLVGCENGVGLPETADVRILLTDAPSDYVGAALIDIGSVQLLPTDGGDRVILSEDGTDGPVDLLDLQGLTTEVLADVTIPAGSYRELRFVIESASVTLADGYEFRDGSTTSTLRVPSGAQSGVKLKLRSGDEGSEDDAGVSVGGGETVLVVDFDVNQSFRIQGNPNTPAGINGVSFKPTLRVVVQDVAGSISGTVSTVLSTSVEGLVVTAETVDPGDDEEFQTQTATAITDADGGYSIYFLPPGSYTVTVGTPDGTTTDPLSAESVVGASEDITEVNFSLVVAS